MDNGQLAWSVIFGILFSIPSYYLFVNNSTHITIERTYIDEYNQCKAQVAELQKSVQCPEVKVNCGMGGIIWEIIGGVFGLLGYAFFLYGLRKASISKPKK